MKKVRLVIDSTADLPSRIAKEFTTVPLPIYFGEQEFLDGVTITHHRFYEMLIESDVLPTTSQASPDAFLQVYRQAVEAGEQVVVITIAQPLSGTYQSAMIAAAEYPEDVFVVNSNSVAIGSGILAQYALSLKHAGMEAKKIAGKLEEAKGRVCVIALLDTLEYLKKGGRISKTAAFAGGLLSIKPVITVKDGQILMLGKARGSKQGNNLLTQEIEKVGGVDFRMPVLLGYTGLSSSLLDKYVEDSRALWAESREALDSVVIGSVVGTHAGPGAVAVAFFHK